MSGLEEVGVPGPDHLREALTNCTDPLAAIEEFQLQNGILLPSLRPALPFLDLHGVMRHDFHQSVTEELRERLLQQIKDIALGSDRNKMKLLNELLMKCISVIHVATLRPVVMCILQHLPKIRHEHLLVIIQDRQLYLEAPVEVKQQIWQDNQALFGDEVSPLLSRYIDLKESQLFSLESASAVFFNAAPKTRRQAAVVQELSVMIGRNIRLYDMVLQFLRTLFMRTRNVHYCTLRAELLMLLHDNDVQEIVTADPCHKFTWCLDACIRDKLVDSKRMRELHGFIDAIGGFNQQQVLGDLAMILCDCQAIQVLSLTVIKCLQQCTASDTLPRHCDDLLFALRMLSLGLGAWNIIDSQVFTEPKLEVSVVTRLLPMLLSLSVDDQLVAMTKDAKDDKNVEPVVISRGASDVVWSTVFTHYCLSVARTVCGVGQSGVCMPGSTATLLRLLATLPTLPSPDTALTDLTLHELVSAIASAAELLSNAQLRDILLDKLFTPMLSRENVCRHVLRLLYFTHQYIPATTTDKILAAIQHNKQTESVRTMMKTLTDKMTTTTTTTTTNTTTTTALTTTTTDVIMSPV